ncbi:Chloroperoxidase [Achaetomium macrosporum]|uniref:Chloroperoxidase n=1 Tax=Achaetomium macrosporum TaxID=79813 RepID=A0AAN7HBI9_9PEZI|nr:Chloroperoxidase [Achaetomium macrosporum]
MKLSVFVEAGLLGLAAALREPKGHEYHRNPRDSRSPCPGLNALANHGYLPRSGLNIDLETLRYAVVAGFNLERTTQDGAFNLAIAFNLSTSGNSSTFHLEDLRLHDAIEFDGSLSRNDFYLGDNLHFNPAIWHTVATNLGLYKTGPSKEDKYVTVEVAAKAAAARVKAAMAANKHFNASESQMQGSPGTTALYLTTLWDDDAGAVPKSWIRALFEEERIPFREGYNPTTRKQKTAQDLGDMFARVTAVDTGAPKGKRELRWGSH